MGFAVGEITAHGLRTTASTFLNESGRWSPDAIERSLAHADPDAIRGIYNRGRYWDERVAMHQWWSDYLDELREQLQAVGRPQKGFGFGAAPALLPRPVTATK